MDVFDEGDCSVEDLVMPRFLYNEDVSRGTWPHNPLDYGVLMASVFREQPCAQACNGVEFEHEVKKILEDPRQRYGSVNGRRGGGGDQYQQEIQGATDSICNSSNGNQIKNYLEMQTTSKM